jgi:hypothetical protein
MDDAAAAHVTEQVEAFMAPLPMYPAQPTRAIIEAVDYVIQEGPAARRPVLGEVSLQPDHRQYIPVFGNGLREIRPLGTDVRILCVFSQERRLVLLYAGDKAGTWKHWYPLAIREAARMYLEYLGEQGS